MPERLRPLAPYVAVIAALYFTYGARATAFTMGPDDFNFRAMSRAQLYRFWMGQDRWGMAVTTYIFGQPILPMIAVAAGVSLIALALWHYLRECLGASPWAAAAGTSLGVTAPPIVFHTGSRTNALGLGVAFVLTVAACRLLKEGGVRNLAIAIILGAYAASTYQTLAVVFGCFLLGMAITSGRWRDVVRAALIPATSLVGGYLFGRLLGLLTSSPSVGYVDVSNPPGTGALTRNARHAVSTYVHSLTGGGWGVVQPWTGLVLITCAAILFYFMALKTPRNLPSITATLLLLMVPLADGYTWLPRRSLVYWAAIVAIVVALAVPHLRRLRPPATIVSAGLIAMALFGNAQVANAQYLGAETVFRAEQFIADRIKDEYLKLDPPPADATIVLIPCAPLAPPQWPTREIFTFGSMVTDGTQAAAALRYDGVPVRKPRVAELLRAYELQKKMPQYPRPGWLRVDGNVLIAKCGPTPAGIVQEAD